jgi:hypothetical protein
MLLTSNLGMDPIKLKLKTMILMFAVLIIVVVAAVLYIVFFINGSATHSVGNNWFSINGASPITTNGKLWVNFIGIEGCQYCAIERYALFDALSNFGNWTYYGKKVELNTLPVSNKSTTPQTNTLFYHAYEGDWTLNFLNPHLKYTSNYVNFTSEELYNDQYPNPSPLQTLTPLENKYISKYDSGGAVPFSLIGGTFFEIGAGNSLAPGGTPIIFAPNGTGYMPEYIISEFNTTGSNINQGITKEAGYITAMICRDINNAAAICSSKSLPTV